MATKAQLLLAGWRDICASLSGVSASSEARLHPWAKGGLANCSLVCGDSWLWASQPMSVSPFPPRPPPSHVSGGMSSHPSAW